jgi:hypothetical protein
MLYTINNTISGVYLGAYIASSERGALDAFAISVGLENYDALNAEFPVREGEIEVTGLPIHEANFSETCRTLLERLDGDFDGWTLYEANRSRLGHVQIVFNKEHGRAGMMCVGSGESGADVWTAAASAEEAFLRYLNDDIIN